MNGSTVTAGRRARVTGPARASSPAVRCTLSGIDVTVALLSDRGPAGVTA